MIICKHNDGGWYGLLFASRHKNPVTRKWEETVLYQRLPVDLKPGEDHLMPYTRTVEDFRINFTPYTLEAFERIAGIKVSDKEFSNFFNFRNPGNIHYLDVFSEAEIVD